MATNNARNNKGQFPVGSVVKYDFSAPTDTKWLLTNGAAVSKTTYAPLYALQGNAYEGTGNLTQTGSIAAATGNSCNWISWHPSSNYIAASSSVSNKQIIVGSFAGTTLTEAASVNVGATIRAVSWSPNGNFLAAVTLLTNLLKVYSWNGSNSLTEVTSIDITKNGTSINWHPSGNYLAVGKTPGGTDELSVYSWNGTDTLTQVETIDYSNYVYGVKWSKSGNYLAAVALLDSHQLDVYSWNGTDTLTYVCAYSYTNGNYLSTVDWSPDDNFIACGGNSDTKQVIITSFNGSSLTERATVNYGTSLQAAVSWSKGGNYLLTCILNTSSTIDCVFLNTWVASTYTLTQTDSISVVSKGVVDISTNYTNNYFAYSVSNTTTSPYNVLYAGTTALTSCDYRTNFLLPTTATSIIRGS